MWPSKAYIRAPNHNKSVIEAPQVMALSFVSLSTVLIGIAAVIAYLLVRDWMRCAEITRRADRIRRSIGRDVPDGVIAALENEVIREMPLFPKRHSRARSWAFITPRSKQTV